MSFLFMCLMIQLINIINEILKANNHIKFSDELHRVSQETK